ncbi:hypothetical protein [Petrachloros mirabilis]
MPAPRTLIGLAMVISTLLGSHVNWIAAAGPVTGGDPVVFVAHDYGFTGPERIPSGVTTVQVVNKGQDVHHIQLLQLLQGKTAEDFRTAMADGSAGLPSWIKFVGGPNAVLPGSHSAATMKLAEGEYLLICLVPDSKGVPHMALGMTKPLSVGGMKPTRVSEPKADVTITLADFKFAPSRPITAGSHTIEVVNRGTQRHELVLVRLNPGATAHEFGAAFEPGASGPPPGMPLGGVVGLETGDHAFFQAKITPGNYGLICFFPDTVTGKPHFMHGMTTEFSVK